MFSDVLRCENSLTLQLQDDQGFSPLSQEVLPQHSSKLQDCQTTER